jgi:hypothetical protein
MTEMFGRTAATNGAPVAVSLPWCPTLRKVKYVWSSGRPEARIRPSAPVPASPVRKNEV